MTNLISILIPVYNRESIIEETVQSALSQTYTNIEVIIIDNASTDNTWTIIEQLAKKDTRIKIYKNKSNIGPVRNWFECIKAANGIYSKILWSDDLISKNFLEETSKYLENHSVGFVYTAVNIFGESIAIENVAYNKLNTGLHASDLYISGILLGGDFPFSPGCALFRTKDLKNNLLIDIPNSINSDFSMHAIGNDLLLYLLTASNYKYFAFIAQPMASFRAHTGSISVGSATSRLFLLYDVAMGYFVDSTKLPKSLVAKFNVRLLLDSIKYNAKTLKIFQINDFYPSKKSRPFSLLYLFTRCARVTYSKLLRLKNHE